MNVKKCEWCLRFAWLPHKCWLTGRWIWLDFAYHKENDRYKNIWHSEESHILWVLKEGH